MFGTKWPSMISMWSQSAPASWMIREHSEKSLPKSEARIEGAIIGLGAIFQDFSLEFGYQRTKQLDLGKLPLVGVWRGRFRKGEVEQVTRST